MPEYYKRELMKIEIQMNEDGSATVPMDDEILKELGWNEHTILSTTVVDGELIVRAKTDWTVDQLQEGTNLERVLEDIEHNKTVHYILDKGKSYVMAPFSTELTELLEKVTK